LGEREKSDLPWGIKEASHILEKAKGKRFRRGGNRTYVLLSREVGKPGGDILQ